MTNFKIEFTHPWLLLLLIPAIGLTLLSYFKLGKRYRRTRNRIASITLHIIIMVLSIAVLAGTTFSYDIPNTENEVILLVDSSYSTNEDSKDDIEDFIKDVIDSSDSLFKLGIVTFGYDQVYAAELTNETSKLYSSYLEAQKPNTTATDIASALTYASTLFNKPETARIVLITDAIETDGSAKNVIKSIAAEGIKVDTVNFKGKDVGYEMQVIDMIKPEDKIIVGKDFMIDLIIESSYEGKVNVTPYDNNVAGETLEKEVIPGINVIQVPYEFTLPGMHEMKFEIDSDYDEVALNNSYLSYIYLEIFDDILIIEGVYSDSETLTEMLSDELKVTVITSGQEEKFPKTVDELRAYDEVILCNVANKDLPAGFDELLYSYVYDFGGGLFTICGSEEGADPSSDDWTANAYTREDMYGTLYQEMLPVEIINYTPPAAVMIIVDTSGSMYASGTDTYEGSKLAYALTGAKACLDALTERDYVGIMTLADSYSEEIELTARTQRDKIISAITTIEENALEGNSGGGTIFSAALERAGKALNAMSNVEKKHIIIVTDGEPASTDEERYVYWFEENAKMGITTSIVGIQCTSTAVQNMTNILVDKAGMTEENFHDVADVEDTPEVMRNDLMVPEIKEANNEPFIPVIKDTQSLIFNNLEIESILGDEDFKFDGFYGVKTKEGANVILAAQYTPLYTEWQFGKGMVGTFACDLNGVWSADFINSLYGKDIVNNIVVSLFPKENIKPSDIDAEWTGDNYTTQLSVFTKLEEGEYIEATITSPIAEGEIEPRVQVISAGASDGYSRMVFSVLNPGKHEILVQKKSADGNVVSEVTIYKMLSYSKEYDMFADKELAEALITLLAEASGGEIITEPEQVFQNASKFIHNVIDPKIAFMIIVIIFFLLDIAARKFKWKWPHEIIRDKKLVAEKNGSLK